MLVAKEIDALPKPMRGWHGNSIKDTAI
jgi:hypothetical protein